MTRALLLVLFWFAVAFAQCDEPPGGCQIPEGYVDPPPRPAPSPPPQVEAAADYDDEVVAALEGSVYEKESAEYLHESEDWVRATAYEATCPTCFHALARFRRMRSSARTTGSCSSGSSCKAWRRR